MSPSVDIREYDAADYPALHGLMCELQEVERRLDPLLPPGAEIADAYLAWVFANCAAHDGKVFLAVAGGRALGFITALARVMPDEPDEPRLPYAYVTELTVAPDARDRGVGAALLARAESHVRERGATRVRTKALAGNAGALRFYARHGFAFREIELEKTLG